MKLDDGLTVAVEWQGKPISLKKLTYDEVVMMQEKLSELQEKKEIKALTQLVKEVILKSGLPEEIYSKLTTSKVNALLELLSDSKKN